MLKYLLTVFVCSIAICLLTKPAIAGYGAFYDKREVASSDLAPFTKWRGVVKNFKDQLQRQQCGDGDCPAARWQEFIKSQQGKEASEMMSNVNLYFNRIKYIEDQDNWGQRDYWATPFEMMSRGADCEDYAIAKYMALKQLGVSENSMRVMIVKDNNLNIMHAILEVEQGGSKYLLDNQISRVAEASEVAHYTPIYAINTRLWWAFK